MKKKYLIGIGTLSAIAILPITVVACATNTSENANNIKKIDVELAKITKDNFLIKDKNKLASEINANNLQTEITKNNATTINGVAFSYALSEKTPINAATGTLTLTLTGKIGTDSRTKEITITGFQTISQRLKQELDKISTLKADKGNFATTLASNVTSSTLSSFVSDPASKNGVSFKLIFLPNSFNDGLGSLSVTLEASIGTIKDSKTITITEFQTRELTLEEWKELISKELTKQNKHEATLVGSLTTLASEVSAQNLNNFILNPVTSNGVSFRYIFKANSADDVKGELTATLQAYIVGREPEDLDDPSQVIQPESKEVIITGFQTRAQRDLIIKTAQIKAELDKIETLTNLEASKIVMPSEVNSTNIAGLFSPLQDQNGVSFKYLSVTSPNDDEGTLFVNIEGSIDNIKSEKMVQVKNFQTIAQRLKQELDKISTLKADQGNFNTTLASGVSNTNLNSFIKNPATVNSVSFRLIFIPNKFTNASGELTVNLQAFIGDKTDQKEIFITGFQSSLERVKQELDKITSTTLKVDMGDFKTTMPSEVDANNLDSFIKNQLPSDTNDVSFRFVFLPNLFNNQKGELKVNLQAFIGNISFGKDILITGFQTIDERAESIEQQNALIQRKLNEIVPKLINTFDTTLPSEVKPENVTKLIEIPAIIEGVSFKITNLSLVNDKNGSLSITIEGSIGDIKISRDISIIGFQTEDQRKELDPNQRIQAALNNLTLVKTGAFATTLPLEVKLDNVASFFEILKPVKDVNLKFISVKSQNDTTGTLTVTIEGSIGEIKVTKDFDIIEFQTIDQRNKAKIQVELDKINLVKTGAFATTLPLEVKVENVASFFNSLPIVEGINLKFINVKLQDDEVGTLTVTIEGSIGESKVTKDFDISGFQTIDQRLDQELAEITTIEANLSAFATTLPSTITAETLKNFISNPTTSNGVSFELIFKANSADDTKGELKVTLKASISGISKEKEITITKFQTTDQSGNQRLDQELAKITTIEANLSAFATTLPSTITAETLKNFISNPTTSNGVSFELIFKTNSDDDTKGELKVTLKASISGISKEKEITITKFQTIDQRLDQELAKITTIEANLSAFATTLPSTITAETLKNFISNPTISNGVSFELIFKANSDDDTKGELKVTLKASISGISKEKEITITKFQTNQDHLNEIINAIKAEIFEIEKQNKLPSEIAASDIKFIKNFDNKGVDLEILEIIPNNANGTLSFKVKGTFKGIEKSSIKIEISNFETNAKRRERILNEITENDIILGINNKNEILPKDINSTIISITNSTRELVALSLEITNRNDELGQITFKVVATLGETTDKFITMSGFLTTQEKREKDLITLQNAYNQITQQNLNINNENEIITALASSMTNELINKYVSINSINGVNFKLEIDSSNDTIGTLNVRVIASFEGQNLNTKILNVNNFKTANMAFGDWLGLSNSEVNTTFFTPSVTNVQSQSNITTMRTFINQIGIMNKNIGFGDVDANRFTLTNYRITDLNNGTTFTKDSKDMKITINGTFDGKLVNFTKELKGYTAIGTILDTLITFTRNEKPLLTASQGNLHTGQLFEQNHLPDRGIVAKESSDWKKFFNTASGKEEFASTGEATWIPSFIEGLHNRNLRLHANRFAWRTSAVENGEQSITIWFHFDQTLAFAGSTDYLIDTPFFTTQKIQQTLLQKTIDSITSEIFEIENKATKLSSSISNADIKFIQSFDKRGVNLEVIDLSRNNTDGTLSFKVKGTFEGTERISEIITISGFLTPKDALAAILGLRNAEVDTTFFIPSRTNLVTSITTLTDMKNKLTEIGLILKEENLGIDNNQFAITSYQLQNSTFDTTTNGHTLIVNGTFNNEAVTYSRRIEGFKPISQDLLNRFFTIEKVGNLILTTPAAGTPANSTFTALLNPFRGVKFSLGDVWAKDNSGAPIFENGFPRFNDELHNKGLRYAVSASAFNAVRWRHFGVDTTTNTQDWRVYVYLDAVRAPENGHPLRWEGKVSNA
ncbi:lipoprotein 17-related variable surface protein [[Mycoplasma] mobile]|nr:lipoprotein 17-related variable surface protein [[Mycoplasma] mobile]